MIGLTKRQAELYDFIKAQNNAGISPTVREMAEHMRYKSASCIIPMLRSMKRRGAVDYLPFTARSVRAL